MRRPLEIAGVLGLLLVTQVVMAVDAEGFRSMFDGKTLEGWDGNPKLWRVEDGASSARPPRTIPPRRNTFLIWRGGKPADFEVKTEFRMPNEGFGNSGVQFRSWEAPEKWQIRGYQADIDRQRRTRASLRRRLPRHPRPSRPEGRHRHGPQAEGRRAVRRGGRTRQVHQGRDWNEYDITAQGQPHRPEDQRRS